MAVESIENPQQSKSARWKDILPWMVSGGSIIVGELIANGGNIGRGIDKAGGAIWTLLSVGGTVDPDFEISKFFSSPEEFGRFLATSGTIAIGVLGVSRVISLVRGETPGARRYRGEVLLPSGFKVALFTGEYSNFTDPLARILVERGVPVAIFAEGAESVPEWFRREYKKMGWRRNKGVWGFYNIGAGKRVEAYLKEEIVPEFPIGIVCAEPPKEDPLSLSETSLDLTLSEAQAIASRVKDGGKLIVIGNRDYPVDLYINGLPTCTTLERALKGIRRVREGKISLRIIDPGEEVISEAVKLFGLRGKVEVVATEAIESGKGYLKNGLPRLIETWNSRHYTKGTSLILQEKEIDGGDKPILNVVVGGDYLLTIELVDKAIREARAGRVISHLAIVNGPNEKELAKQMIGQRWGLRETEGVFYINPSHRIAVVCPEEIVVDRVLKEVGVLNSAA